MNKSYQVYTLYQIVEKRVRDRQRYMNNQKFINNKQEWYYERLVSELNPKHTRKTHISAEEYTFIKNVINDINKMKVDPTKEELKRMDEKLIRVKTIFGKHTSRNPNDDIDLSYSPKAKVKQNFFNTALFKSKRKSEVALSRTLGYGEQYKSRMIDNFTALSNNKERFNTEQIERLKKLIKQVQGYKHDIITQNDVQRFQNAFQDIMKNKNPTVKNKGISKLHRLFDKVKKYGSNYFTR